MTKGQDQRGSYLPPLGHSSRDTLYLQLFLSTTETSTDLPTGKSSSDSTLRSTPSSHQSTFNNLTSDPASIRRTQSHHPHTTHPLVTSPQVFTTSEFHASKLNRGFRRPPSPAIRPGKCPHCSVVLKWPNGLRKHVQVSHSCCRLGASPVFLWVGVSFSVKNSFVEQIFNYALIVEFLLILHSNL